MIKKKVLGILGSLLCVILAGLIAAMTVLGIQRSTFITMWWSSFSETGNSALPEGFTADDANENSKNNAIQVMEEGVVMLKNEDNTLPLRAGTKINLFGYYGAVSPLYGSSGSVSTGTTIITSKDYVEGFEQAGFSVNQDLVEWQKSNAPGTDEEDNFFDFASDCKVIEFPWEGNKGISSQLESAKAYSDVAVYVISRSGSESGDSAIGVDGENNKGDESIYDDTHYLTLTSRERAMIENLSQNFGTFILLVCSTTQIEYMEALEEYDIDACLDFGTLGTWGTYGVGNIMAGKANPSGKLTVTYSYDVTDNPAYYSYLMDSKGTSTYTNAADFTTLATAQNEHIKRVATDSELASAGTFHYYFEGIYVGYKWYETAYIGTDNVYTEEEEAEYREHVKFPFGYGQSYTSFEWSNPRWEIGEKGGEVKVTVTVKNVGSVAGKDVVQVYMTPPYEVGGIEKAAVNLMGYAKTSLLEAGESEDITITFDYDDMASYDSSIEKCYVLDAGEYKLSLRKDAHTVADGTDMEHLFSVSDDIVYKDSADGKRGSDEVEAVNRFDMLEEGDGTINDYYISRATFEEDIAKVKELAERNSKSVAASQTVVDAINSPEAGAYLDGAKELEESIDPNDFITTEANNGLTVEQMVGVAYDDPLWEDLLDNLSIAEMQKLYADGAYRVAEVQSIGMDRTVDADGPQGLNAATISQYGTRFPGGITCARTWNDALIEEMGKCLGDEYMVQGVIGIYGPSFNIIQSAFGGRNGEMYSEDALVSGKIAAAFTRGAQGEGCCVYLKHYAAYGHSTNAGAQGWMTEQTLREIYVKGFEIAIKEADALGMMASYSRIGTSSNYIDYELLTALPRGEWGFEGAIVTDSTTPSWWDPDLGLKAGMNLILNTGYDSGAISFADSVVSSAITKTAYGQYLLRENAKTLIYRYANSGAITTVRDYTPTWIALIAGVAVAFVVEIVLVAVFVVKPAFKKEENA